MNTSATRPPRPSTRAFVANVVESDTNAMSAEGTWALASTVPTAAAMPSARSWRVVSALAFAMTPFASSKSTASVYVPPVSMPSEIVMRGFLECCGSEANCIDVRHDARMRCATRLCPMHRTPGIRK